jgi:flagellar hook-basal body complex protein FliE
MYVRADSITRNLKSIDKTTLHHQDNSQSIQKPFENVLQKADVTLSNMDQEVMKAQADLISGNARDLHTAVLAVEKSSIALDLLLSVRNKAIEAYQEIMRMPI